MIRAVKASDIKYLMQLIEDSIYQADPDAVPSEHYMLEAITMSMKPKTLLYLKVCERNDKIVGYLAAQVTPSFMLSTNQANVITSHAIPNHEDCLKDLFEDMCEWAYSLAAYDVFALTQNSSNGLSDSILLEVGAKPISTEYSYQLDRE